MDDDCWDLTVPTMTVYERADNPDHQGFIGFIPPRTPPKTKTRRKK